MKKQTALDWYWDKIKSHFEHDGDLFETATFTFAIAKQKEKEQIIDATYASRRTGEGYYDETYGSKGSDETKGGYICPATKVQCDDECCVSAKDCHIQASEGILSESPQIEISDEEIEEASEQEYDQQSKSYEDDITDPFYNYPKYLKIGFIDGVKWYREQLKQK